MFVKPRIRTIFFVFIFICNVISYGFGYNVLAFFPAFSKSHLILVSELFREIASRGNNVTLVSTLPFSIPSKNYRNLIIKDAVQDVGSFFVQQQNFRGNLTIFDFRDQVTPFQFATMYPVIGNIMVQSFTNDIKLRDELLNSHNNYDIVIVENFGCDAFLGFGPHYNVPTITFESVAPTHLSNRLTGNYNPYSVVPEKWFDFTDRMSFLERAHNFLFGVRVDLFYENHLSEQEKTFKELFPNIPVSLRTLMTNVSLVLTNSHPGFTFPRALAPNIIEVGGLHVATPKPLPKVMQEFLDEAKDGAIFFSLGSNMKSTFVPQSMVDAFLNVFKRLKLTVLWKWDDDTLPNCPSNVLISKWFPQNDILAHKNIKAFITHGGLLSQTESVHYGVPLLGIPLFSDQYLNVKRAEINGFGLTLDVKNITEESLSWALNEIINNTKYQTMAKFQSSLLRDQQVKPIDRAIFWIEFVMRHKGASHLRMASTEMNFFQRYLVDIIAAFALVTFICSYVFLLFVKFLKKKFS